jgi:hypothetical protein
MTAQFKKIRVQKSDSAFVHYILESYEGVTGCTTLDFSPVDAHRDLLLHYSPDFAAEVDELLATLGDKIYELKD